MCAAFLEKEEKEEADSSREPPSSVDISVPLTASLSKLADQSTFKRSPLNTCA